MAVSTFYRLFGVYRVAKISYYERKRESHYFYCGVSEVVNLDVIAGLKSETYSRIRGSINSTFLILHLSNFRMTLSGCGGVVASVFYLSDV